MSPHQRRRSVPTFPSVRATLCRPRSTLSRSYFCDILHLLHTSQSHPIFLAAFSLLCVCVSFVGLHCCFTHRPRLQSKTFCDNLLISRDFIMTTNTTPLTPTTTSNEVDADPPNVSSDALPSASAPQPHTLHAQQPLTTFISRDDPLLDADVKSKTPSSRRGKQYKCGHCHQLGHNQYVEHHFPMSSFLSSRVAVLQHVCYVSFLSPTQANVPSFRPYLIRQYKNIVQFF